MTAVRQGSGCETGVLVQTEGSGCETHVLVVRQGF